MSNQIIKQPNGKYALWSSVVDDFVLVDGTREEIIQEFVDRAMRDIERLKADVAETIDKIDAGDPAYMQFTLTFEAVDFIRQTKGEAESLRMLGLTKGDE